MRVSLYVPFVLLCALLMSACTSEEEQAQQAQDIRDRAQKSAASTVEFRIQRAVVARTGPRVSVGCPDTVDKIIRLGCLATAWNPFERLSIKVARTGQGDFINEEYRVVINFLDTLLYEESLRKALTAAEPTRFLLRLRCPALVERKKGVRFVCKGDEPDDGRFVHTVRVRARFSRDGGDPKIYEIQRVPAPSP